MRRLTIAAAILLCFYLPFPTFAQTTNATVGGTVSDASGALIPGVEITATNTQTGIVNKTLTIIGAGIANTFVQPGAGNIGFEIRANGIVIQDLTMQDGGTGAAFPVPSDDTELDRVAFSGQTSRGIDISAVSVPVTSGAIATRPPLALTRRTSAGDAGSLGPEHAARASAEARRRARSTRENRSRGAARRPSVFPSRRPSSRTSSSTSESSRSS